MIAAATMLAAIAAAWPRAAAPLLVWNASASVPTGFYVVTARNPRRGELAVVHLPQPLRRLTHERGYMSARAFLIKPVAAAAGDIVCRHGPVIEINGKPVAVAMTADRKGWPLPQWAGCHQLDDQHVFLLGVASNSLDSRYFGALNVHEIVGTAAPVWNTANPDA